MNVIYIDNKINGAIDQLIKYFDDGVFNKQNVKVVFKVYLSSYSYYKKILEENGIKFIAFKSLIKLDLSEYKVVFYLFNAQSNCRIVANRNAKHVFLTHGESNKVSSIKPIIRIYDHVICSGKAGIDRFLQSGIFGNHDISTGRLIMMGDTFIGQPKYYKSMDSKKASILYAPTWEGGIKMENYSSISKDLLSFQTIIDFLKENEIKEIIIQPHPNTGHRDIQYKKYLENGIDYLVKEGFGVVIYGYKKENFTLNFRIKNYFNSSISFSDNKKEYGIYRAFVDVSAMEVQLVNKEIPTNIFLSDISNAIPNNQKLNGYYNKTMLYYPYSAKKIANYDNSIIENIKPYYISYSFNEVAQLKLNERINWLVKYILNKN